MRRFGFNLVFNMAALLLAVMSVFAGVGFASLSLYLYLVTVTTAPLAALATAVAALLFALIVALIAGIVARGPGHGRAGEDDEAFAGLAEALSIGKTLGLEGRTFLTSHLSNATFVLFGLGLAMGLSPRLRRLITDLLRR
jgi:hypothetical protein